MRRGERGEPEHRKEAEADEQGGHRTLIRVRVRGRVRGRGRGRGRVYRVRVRGGDS